MSMLGEDDLSLVGPGHRAAGSRQQAARPNKNVTQVDPALSQHIEIRNQKLASRNESLSSRVAYRKPRSLARPKTAQESHS